MHFLGSKITFGENGESLVKCWENAESGRFRQKSRNGHQTPTQYRSNAVFRPDQKSRAFTHPRCIFKRAHSPIKSGCHAKWDAGKQRPATRWTPFHQSWQAWAVVHREPRCVLGPASDRQPWLLACLVSEIAKCAKTASPVRALLPPSKGRAHRKLMTRYTSSEGLHRKIPGPACEMLHPFGHALHCLHATIFYLHAIRYQTRKIHKMPKNPAKIPHDPSDAQKNPT